MIYVGGEVGGNQIRKGKKKLFFFRQTECVCFGGGLVKTLVGGRKLRGYGYGYDSWD